jgi:hypothetical protein
MKKKRKKANGNNDDEDDNDDDDKPKRIKRPDRAQRLQERKNLENSVIKCSLAGRLSANVRHWTPDARAVMVQLLDEQVESLSQMIVRGSMVANEVLLTCLRENVPLPDLSNNNFFRHCVVGKSNNPVVNRVLQTHFANHPEITRVKGDWAAVNIMTNRYAVNAQNSFIHAFLNRQRAFVAKWLEFRQLPKTHKFGIIQTINGWPGATPNHFQDPAIHELIKRHRQLLQEPQDLHPKDLHPHVVIRYYYELQQFYDHAGFARISLLPLCDQKRHFMTIDSTVLLNLLLNVFEKMGEQAPTWIQDIALYNNMCSDAIHACRDEMWHKTFDLKTIKRSLKRTFDHQVDTDGIAACFHFTFPKRGGGGDDTSAGTSENVNPFVDAKRIIAIDPGRTNMVTAYDSYFNKYHTLTRKEYYGAFSGSTRKLQGWEDKLQPVHEEMSEYSLRSADVAKCQGYRNVYFKWYYAIWTSRLALNRAREKLNIFSKKKQVLDRFFANMRGPKDAPTPKVAYGASSIRPHAHGEMAVPVKGVLKVCRKYYSTTMVNEYLTTKTHEACGSRMHPVMNEDGAPNRPIRGLYWCPTCGKFVNRDRNAAINILLLARCTEGRPDHLAFGQAHVQMQTLALLPVKKTRE